MYSLEEFPMEGGIRRLILLVSFLISSLFLSHCPAAVAVAVAAAQGNTTAVPVGVILNLQTLLGIRSRTTISMAIDDFYAAHANFTTRVVLHLRDSSQYVVGAAAAALDLLENVQTQAIICPMTSGEVPFIADLGSKTHVPILSFSATSPSLSPLRYPYFVRTTLNDSSQVGAIVAVVKSFGWRQVVVIYEDTDFGSGIIPFLVDGLEAIGARIRYRSAILPFATEEQIAAELYKLRAMETRVFVIHMMPDLGSRLFSKAKEVGLMDSGYVWIMTDSISNALDLLDAMVIDAMQGALGILPYVPTLPEDVKGFSARWKMRFLRDNPGVEPSDLIISQLWAYDTAWALAMAVEKAGIVNSSFVKPPGMTADNTAGLGALGVSQPSASLLDEIVNRSFSGISGEFRLVDGQLQSSAFEIVNVIGKGARSVGFWTPDGGISKQLNSTTGEASPSLMTSANDMKTIIWPGDSPAVPKGWELATAEKLLKVGVPVRQGFHQLVNVKRDPITNATTVTGYCIDVFDAVIQTLPYAVPYEYVPFVDDDGNPITDYDLLVYQVYLQNFDMVVGDTTIIANRTLYVDFTLPYTESGVSMVAPIKQIKSNNMWILLEPLTINQWLGTTTYFFFTGLLVWMIEHRINRGFRGLLAQQLESKLRSNLSRFIVIIWVSVVLFHTSRYTASLTRVLTVQQLQPTVTSVNELLKNRDYVGYVDGSFVEGLLKTLKFSEQCLKAYHSSEQYEKALCKGSQGGGVAAIFAEIPYLKLFLSNHCADYTMVGPTYKTAGFGFVLPKGSPLMSDISLAVLNVTQGDKMAAIERKWFGDPMKCLSRHNSRSPSRLNFESFGDLLLLTAVASSLALLVFLAVFVYKNWIKLLGILSDSHLDSQLHEQTVSRDHSVGVKCTPVGFDGAFMMERRSRMVT